MDEMLTLFEKRLREAQSEEYKAKSHREQCEKDLDEVTRNQVSGRVQRIYVNWKVMQPRM